MPAHCRSNKSEPIAFDCPCCGAKYVIVTLAVATMVQHSKFSCVKCDALFPLGEGRVSLEYLLVSGGPDE
jgi:transcription elongation factor Elf1